MSTEALLSVLAILRAYAIRDAEGIEVLIKDAPASAYADLIEFVLMVLGQNTDDRAVAYLDHLAQQAYALHLHEAARAN